MLSSSIHRDVCPVCESKSIGPLHTIRDHSVSGESFVVWQCRDCTLRFTQDAPDAESIGLYYQSDAYISHTDTDQGLIARLYKRVRQRTLRDKRLLVQRETGRSGGTHLDLGAGTGAFAHEMQQAGWHVTGVEPDGGARQKAQQLYGLQLQTADRFSQLPPGSFNAITLWHVLEHVHDLQGYVQQLKALLAPGGKLFIAVPNYTAAEADLYRGFWAAYDLPRHLYHFSPTSMHRLLRSAGLRVTKQEPMWWDSFYISLLSSKYRKDSMAAPRAFFNGLYSNAVALLQESRCSSIIYVVELGAGN